MVSSAALPGFETDVGPKNGFTEHCEIAAEIKGDATVKNRQKNRKSVGGFQAMGFSPAINRGIARRGYKLPTPIQRKCIPPILDGKDVVAMARTGSGKTACFLLPLLERLKKPASRLGARALILSPTRELALQTLRFARDLGRFVDVRAAVVLGGDSMEQQFAAMHQRPDIVVATPGRFMHLCVEMQLRLDAIEYVVFDEADRLFELGFAEQLREILARLPENRQTLLFSATLPTALVEFARAGLKEPLLIRLDTEHKLPDKLRLAHVNCRDDERSLVLLQLLQHIVTGENVEHRTLVFVPTRHHVEYVRQLLTCAGISCTFLYSSMDPEARRDNAGRFQANQVHVMVVTDVAARGIDIPHLDNVINYNFPTTAKLFVHRVGRVARAGRCGTAYSLLSSAEMPYLFDLYLFLGEELRFVGPNAKFGTRSVTSEGGDDLVKTEDDWSGQLGGVPQHLIDAETDRVRLWHESNGELSMALRTSQNAYKQYLRTRAAASKSSVRRVKQCDQLKQLGLHPIFAELNSVIDNGSSSGIVSEFLEAVRNFKTSKTIFEVGATTQTEASRIMQAKRLRDAGVIERAAAKRQRRFVVDPSDADDGSDCDQITDKIEPLKNCSEADLSAAFTIPSQKLSKKSKKASSRSFRDLENYISYVSRDQHAEAGYAVKNDFERQTGSAVLDLTTDDSDQMRRNMSTKRWDPKKKAYVGQSNDGKHRKIKTESGVWIPASFQKSGRYDQWRKASHIDAHQAEMDVDDAGDDGQSPGVMPRGARRKNRGRGGVHVMGYRQRDHLSSDFKGAGEAGSSNRRAELRSSDQILRRRDLAERRRRRSTVGVTRCSKRGSSTGSGHGVRSKGGRHSGRGASSRGRPRAARGSARSKSRGSSRASSKRGRR